MALLLSSAPFSLMALLLPREVAIQPRGVRDREPKHGREQASELRQVRDHDRVSRAVRAPRDVRRVEDVVPLFADHARDEQRLFYALGFRVQGSGFSVQCSGFRVRGSGVRV